MMRRAGALTLDRKRLAASQRRFIARNNESSVCELIRTKQSAFRPRRFVNCDRRFARRADHRVPRVCKRLASGLQRRGEANNLLVETRATKRNDGSSVKYPNLSCGHVIGTCGTGWSLVRDRHWSYGLRPYQTNDRESFHEISHGYEAVSLTPRSAANDYQDVAVTEWRSHDMTQREHAPTVAPFVSSNAR